MILRKEDMTVEMGCNSTVDLLLLSAFTTALKASFNILLPILLSLHSKLENQMQRNYNTPSTSNVELQNHQPRILINTIPMTLIGCTKIT